ncbi:peptide transport system ATP-binding protein SapF [Rodentibacter pneumotropicus]|uniref:Peptide transport system ATP-binding protein SapF n=1 Tax=Rodentibacter pneumotropicus TaxID=758 RepID=A0A448MQD4_9PAST|nr:peptide transport system ATP-binding protein SapF [Rodentibacter pneumotropicus]
MPLLEVIELSKAFNDPTRWFGSSMFNAVERVSFNLEKNKPLQLSVKMVRENRP